MNAEPLIIACAADRPYALPLAVMLRSAAVNLDPRRPANVYVADGGLGLEARAWISVSLPNNVTIQWMAPERTGFVDLPLWGRMSISTYDKLALGQWLPRFVERALWLDCDLLVLTDLTRLWQMAVGGHCVHAIQDSLVPTIASRFGVTAYEEMGLEASAEYFNAGVMLVDVARWRTDKIADRALRYLRQNRRRVVFWEQEALNATLAGKWTRLDSRWNWNVGWNHATFRNRARGDTPWILHFAGGLKPWQFEGHSPAHELFYRYLDSTAWAGWRPAHSWGRAILSHYESSRIRGLLFPVELMAMAVQRTMTLRYVSADGNRSVATREGHGYR